MAMDASAARYEEMFAYKEVPGRAGQSHGLQLAARAGMPTSVLARAAVLLAQHTGQHNVPKRLISTRDSSR